MSSGTPVHFQSGDEGAFQTDSHERAALEQLEARLGAEDDSLRYDLSKDSYQSILDKWTNGLRQWQQPDKAKKLRSYRVVDRWVWTDTRNKVGCVLFPQYDDVRIGSHANPKVLPRACVCGRFSERLWKPFRASYSDARTRFNAYARTGSRAASRRQKRVRAFGTDEVAVAGSATAKHPSRRHALAGHAKRRHDVRCDAL